VSDLKRLLSLVRHTPGWRVEPTRGGHWRCIPPDRRAPIVIAASSPSDVMARRAFEAQLRRAGLNLGGRPAS